MTLSTFSEVAMEILWISLNLSLVTFDTQIVHRIHVAGRVTGLFLGWNDNNRIPYSSLCVTLRTRLCCGAAFDGFPIRVTFHTGVVSSDP